MTHEVPLLDVEGGIEYVSARIIGNIVLSETINPHRCNKHILTLFFEHCSIFQQDSFVITVMVTISRGKWLRRLTYLNPSYRRFACAARPRMSTVVILALKTTRKKYFDGIHPFVS